MSDETLRQATCALLGQICKRYQGETNSRLQAMERSGMVERRRARHDQRVVQVFLTHPGRASRPAVEAIWRTVEGCAFGDFSADEERELHRLLGKLDANLARLAEQRA